MTRLHSPGMFISVVLATLAYGQTTQPKSKAAVPVTMTECEGTNNCATWTFLGGQGNGNWPSGEIANLTVESSDANTVVIRRADSTGASAGLTVVYKGTRHGDRVGGEFTSSWPGHWDNKAGNWYATIGKVPQKLPPRDGVWVQANVTATMTVESFSPESVIIRRIDSAPRTGFAYVYSGKISSQGNSVLDGVWTGEAGSRQAGASGRFTATWGAALNDNPAARSQPVIVARPVVCYGWFFVVCQ